MNKSQIEINKDIAGRITQFMLEKKALDIRILDVRKLTTLADYFVICSSQSPPQTKAILDQIHKGFRKEKVKPVHIEGHEQLSWVLIDYGDVIAHIFLEDTRNYYGIERLWADADTQFIQALA